MNLIACVQEKLKQQVPSDKQLQMSHFAKFVELINDNANSQQTSEINQMIQQLILFNFPYHTYAMLSNSISLLIANLGNESIKQIIELLLQHINKKGSLKSIALTLLINLIHLTNHDIQPFSFTLTQEITTTLMKLLKSSDYRIFVCNVLYFLIETQKQEILKYAIKFAQNDKIENIQHIGYYTLIQLMEKDVISEQMFALAYKLDDYPIFYKYFARYLFQQQNIIALTKKDKLKQQVQLQPREQAQKIFQLFDENLSKFPQHQVGNIFLAYKKYLSFEFKKLGLPIIRGSFEISCSYLGAVQLDDPYLHQVYKKCQHLCLYMIQQVQLNDRKDLLEYFFDKLSKAQGQKWNVYIYKLLLKGMNFLFDTLGSNVFDEKRSKPSEFIDALIPFFKVGDVLQHQLYIDKPICVSVSRNLFNIFESIFQENKKWQQSILSAILYYAKITLAELNAKETNSLLNQLRVQCSLLSKLFSLLDLQLHSVSSELINHLWETAKSFLNKSFPLRRIGWIVISQLLTVPYFGTVNKVKEISILIEQSLQTKEEIKDEAQLLNYCSVGLAIISILTTNHLGKTIKDTTRKFLAQQTVVIFQKLQINKFEKQSPYYVSAKYIFYQSIRQITPKYYSNELNQLVQFCLEDIMNGNLIWNNVDIHKNNHYVDELLGIPRSEFQMIMAASKFLGHIMSSQAFTLKNKVNFIRYVNGTIQSQVLNMKETQSKYSKQQCFLFCLNLIASKIHQANTVVSAEFNEQIFSVINFCQCSDSQIQQLCALLYCSMLQIKDVDQAEQLNLLLSQKSQANYTYLVMEILNKKLSGVQLQTQNLFMKVLSQMTTDVAKVIELFQHVDSSFLKNAWVFLVSAISSSDKTIQIKQFKILSEIILNYIRNGGQIDNYFNIIYQECRCRLQQKPFQLLQLDFAMGMDSEQTVQQTINLLLKKPTIKIANFLDILIDKYKVPQLVKSILFVLNSLFSNQRVHSQKNEMDLRNQVKNIFVKVYNSPLADLLSLLQPYILEEFVPDQEQRIPIHMRTRIFLLKRLQKLFKQCETSTQIFDFLFKITTSIYEEAKEISFDMFQHFFYKEKDLLNFAAQIDSILCDTIRRENQNSPSVNLTNMKLMSKFAKIVKDEFLARKLIQLLSQPLLNEGKKKLVPSQFFSEKSQLNILIQRIVSLGSIYRKAPQYFSQQQVEQLLIYVEELLEDVFVFLCSPRSFIREYQNYNFAYSGKKYSYDIQFLHNSLPKLLRISKLDKQIHFALIGYTITQYGPFDQNENMFKKTLECLSKEKIQQTHSYRIKGISLLTEALIRNPQNQELIQGIQSLLPIIASESAYSLNICFNFYQTIAQYQMELELIIEPLIQIYTLTQEKNLKLNCLIILLKLMQHNIPQNEEIVTLFWDFLLNQEFDFFRCSQLISFYSEKMNQPKNYGRISVVLQQFLNSPKLRPEDLYILLNLGYLITNNQDEQNYQQIVDKQFTNLVTIALNYMNQTKQCSQIFLISLLPAIYRKIIEKNNESFVIIVKFLLLNFLLSPNKLNIFISTFKLIYLLTDDQLDASIVNSAKQALKLIVMNTQIDKLQLQEELMKKVQLIQAEIEKEQLEKKQKEAQQKQIQQSGVIKLKMFG